MEIVQGQITDMNEDGAVTIIAKIPSISRALVRRYKNVEIGLCDGRSISPEQRKKAYALLREINDWIGATPDYTKKHMKMEFVVNRLNGLSKQMFSLSDCDMNTASEFISFLVEFILENDIPCYMHSLSELCDDIERYVYTCLINKKCAVCGQKSDLHHVDAIGMGNDRNEVSHLGRRALPLCREHHGECHYIGNNFFMKKYHLEAIPIDEKICKKYRLKV